MEERYEIKSEYLGPEDGLKQEIRVLNRVLRWMDHGLEYEPDQCHAELIIRDLGMDGAKPVSTPVTAETKDELEDRDWMALTRVARYLAGAPQFIQKFEWQTVDAEVRAYTDSDWAGDWTTRKSTSGGVVMSGSHLLMSGSHLAQAFQLKLASPSARRVLRAQTFRCLHNSGCACRVRASPSALKGPATHSGVPGPAFLSQVGSPSHAGRTSCASGK